MMITGPPPKFYGTRDNLRPRECGSYGRSESAARPDISDTTRATVSPGLPPAGEAAHGAGAVSISRIPAKQRPPSHTEETTIYPTISSYLAQTCTADLRHDAQPDTMARAARGLGCRRPGLRPWVLHRTGAEPGSAQAARPTAAGDTPAC
jgi:hypothetical protein